MADNTNDKSGGKKIDYDFAAHERPLFQAWMDAGYFQRTPELGALYRRYFIEAPLA